MRKYDRISLLLKYQINSTFDPTKKIINLINHSEIQWIIIYLKIETVDKK